MKLSEPSARERLAAARVARLATTGHDGQPHLVPVTFALDSDSDSPSDGAQVYIAVDHKPKTTTSLRRLRNIRENPRVTLLADHYEEEWARLWWVRADGRARVIDVQDPGREHPLDVLARKYEQYRRIRPAGPVIAITAERITGWSGEN